MRRGTVRGSEDRIKSRRSNKEDIYLLECFLSPKTYYVPLPGEVQLLSGAASVSKIKWYALTCSEPYPASLSQDWHRLDWTLNVRLE